MDKNRLLTYIRPMKPFATSLHFQGQPSNRIKAVLFDIYGTLFISSSGDIADFEKQTANHLKIKTLLQNFNIKTPVQELLDNLQIAIKQKHAELKTSGVDFPEVKIEQIWQQLLNNKDKKNILQFALEFELLVNPIFSMPNLLKSINFLHEKKISLGIISNAQFYTPILMEFFLKNDLVSMGFLDKLLFFSYKFGYAKPSDFLFKKAVEQLKILGIEAKSVLYLGNDMLKDIYPAKRAGFQTALFAGDKRSLRLRKNDLRCKSIKPNLIITDLIQLTQFF